MKALKISLAVIVAVAIAIFIIRSLDTTPPKPKISLPENQCTTRIEQETDSLKKLPDSKFCNKFYHEVVSEINSFHGEGRFSKIALENDQWKEYLTKSLYSAYADKFIQQSFYVFYGLEWRNKDLQVIRYENQSLRKSDLLEKGSPVDNKLTEIETIINKYYEIAGFVSACKSFSYSSTELEDRFPTSDVQEKISRAKEYQNNRLGNRYVNRCARLHEDLKDISQVLFQTHVRYLDNKINSWVGMYSHYNSQPEYNSQLGQPLADEIATLDNSIYNVSNFDSEYQRLWDKWKIERKIAYEYKY